tara:strand:+ start:755 stop:1429 length:675 start_codon:yes stop_codon:yes gene_type:complete
MSEVDKMSRKEVLQPNKAERLLYKLVDHVYRKRLNYSILVGLLVFFLLTAWGINLYFQNERINQANLFHNAKLKLNDSTLSEEERTRQGVLALKEFAMSESVSKLSVLALLESGKIYANQLKFDESILEFKKVLEHPEASNFLKNVSRLSLSALYEQKKEWDESLKMLDSIEIDSWDDLRWRAKARIALTRGDMKKAKKLLEQLVEKFSDSIFRQEAEIILLSL